MLVRFCYRFVAVFITCVCADSGCYFNSVDLCYGFDVLFWGFVTLDISVVVLMLRWVSCCLLSYCGLLDCCYVACCAWFGASGLVLVVCVGRSLMGLV